MARNIAVFEIKTSSIRERRTDVIALRSGVSAAHIVGVLVNHGVLLAGIDCADAADAESAFVLASDIARGAQRRRVADGGAGRVDEERHGVGAVEFARRTQADSRIHARRRKPRRRIDVAVRAVDLAHSGEAIRIEPVEFVRDKHVVHLLDLLLRELFKRNALVCHVRLRAIVIRDEHIDCRHTEALLRFERECLGCAVIDKFAPSSKPIHLHALPIYKSARRDKQCNSILVGFAAKNQPQSRTVKRACTCLDKRSTMCECDSRLLGIKIRNSHWLGKDKPCTVYRQVCRSETRYIAFCANCKIAVCDRDCGSICLGR